MSVSPNSSEGSLGDILRLIRSDNIGPLTYWKLIQQFGSPRQAIEALLSLKPGESLPGFRFISLASVEAIEREREAHHKKKTILLEAQDPRFPQHLRHLPDCPPVISVRGCIETLQQPLAFAIVGARNGSLAARHFAQKIASEMGKEGWIIISGLARGIDGSAHSGALETGTVAVVAGGVDVVYPPEHGVLAGKIQETGCILSEMPLGFFPSASFFPRRNRLISGISLGILVVEAALKSGSLITARFALDQGKEIFAVPGSPLDLRCRGTNDLLRQGAHLVESAQDILSILESCIPASLERLRFGPPGKERVTETPQDGLEDSLASLFPQSLREPAEEEIASDLSLAHRIYQDLSPCPVEGDQILAAYSHYSPAEVMAALSSLELQGQLRRYPHGKISRADP